MEFAQQIVAGGWPVSRVRLHARAAEVHGSDRNLRARQLWPLSPPAKQVLGRLVVMASVTKTLVASINVERAIGIQPDMEACIWPSRSMRQALSSPT